ncbi:MAG TPA: CehA/McbA family metallohydrolase [Actinomycetota bacterium]|nr:CehA/McbA family metallohydrolase [Actinomycetota bacterium]
MTVYRGRWTAEDKAQAPYRYVPFDVGPGVPAVAVELDYDRSAATLDLGVFDPAGFRGWSGGARSGFVITPLAATPGYLPGELAAGEWRVILGLYRVPAGGVEFTLDVRLGSRRAPPPLPPPPPLPERPPRRRLPAAPGRRWLAGDLHAHTVHSDGSLTVDELAGLARGHGLDFLAVTDHNTVSHHADLPAAAARTGVLLVPGQEVTTGTGHANCLGGRQGGWVDFRGTADDWLAAAEAGAGLLSLNHPVLPGDLGWRRPLRRGVPLVEVWHWTWDGYDPAPLAWWLHRGGVPVGGSDFHRPGQGIAPGGPTTWVEAEDHDVLGALAAGRVALAADPAGPVVLRHGGELLVAGGDGAILVAPDAAPHAVRGDLQAVAAASGPYRLLDPSGRTLALTP